MPSILQMQYKQLFKIKYSFYLFIANLQSTPYLKLNMKHKNFTKYKYSKLVWYPKFSQWWRMDCGFLDYDTILLVCMYEEPDRLYLSKWSDKSHVCILTYGSSNSFRLSKGNCRTLPKGIVPENRWNIYQIYSLMFYSNFKISRGNIYIYIFLSGLRAYGNFIVKLIPQWTATYSSLEGWNEPMSI
jgi:hypothetical protein